MLSGCRQSGMTTDTIFPFHDVTGIPTAGVPSLP